MPKAEYRRARLSLRDLPADYQQARDLYEHSKLRMDPEDRSRLQRQLYSILFESWAHEALCDPNAPDNHDDGLEGTPYYE